QMVPSKRVWAYDFPPVALIEFGAFVVVDRAALRERLNEAACIGRGVEKQHAAGVATGILPGMWDIARHECAGARPADGNVVADLESEFAGEHPGDLVAVTMQMIEARGAAGQSLLEHHDALAGLAPAQFHREGAAGCRRVETLPTTRGNDK